MKKHVPGFAAGVGVSAVIACLAWPVDTDLSPSTRPTAAESAGVSPQPQPPPAQTVPASTTKASAPEASALTQPVRESPAQTQGLPAKAASDAALELPGGKLGAQRSGDSDSLDRLLSSMKVRCTFDRGAGGQWPSGKLFPHSAAWQGGPVDFESVDILDNRARLVGNPGVTGTIDGVTDIRVTASNSGLHFSALKPDGELFATTVFGALDSDGRYLAVMSTHGTGFDHESAQFYGACTL